MKRWMVAVVAALALAGGLASPAVAQQPGSNGEKAWVWEGIYFMAPCLTDEDDPVYDPAGGVTWARGGDLMGFTSTGVASDGSQPPQLFVRNTVGCTTPRSLGRVDEGSTASFSPDGKQVAVQRNGRVLILSVSTGALVRDLTAGKDPSWDPTGRGIAYVASDGIRVRPPTGGTSRLFRSSAKAPDYSPDGTKIAYLQSGRIKYAPAGGGTTVTTPISALNFTWSPDGRLFLFISTTQHVIVARTSGYITERLTNPDSSPNVHSHPAWRPMP